MGLHGSKARLGSFAGGDSSRAKEKLKEILKEPWSLLLMLLECAADEESGTPLPAGLRPVGPVESIRGSLVRTPSWLICLEYAILKSRGGS